MREFPLAGARRDRLARGLRAVIQAPYIIYYLPTSEAVVIVRVLHGARDAAALAKLGGFV